MKIGGIKMKNLSFTEFVKDLEKQNEGATETEVVKIETFTDFCSQQKISLAEAEQKQMELLEEKKQQFKTIKNRAQFNSTAIRRIIRLQK